MRTLSEISVQYGIPVAALRRFIREGKLRAVKVDRRWMLDPEEVMDADEVWEYALECGLGDQEAADLMVKRREVAGSAVTLVRLDYCPLRGGRRLAVPA